MSATAVPNRIPDKSARLATAMSAVGKAEAPRIPASFQLMLGIYVILTGTLPTIIQAMAYGLHGGAASEFALAMVTGFAFDLLTLIPIIVLANHPLGILHPLVIATVIWPVVLRMPTMIESWGNWAGVLSGLPVQPVYYTGIPTRSASVIWNAVAKDNGLLLFVLACTYIGFWGFKERGELKRINAPRPDPQSVRTVMMVLIGISLFVLVFFVRARGGLDEHLTSLGNGRFKELSMYGPVTIIISLGAVALYVWLAAKPDDIRSPLFLAAMVAVCASQFINAGSRGGAIEVPLMIGFVWAVSRQKIPWKIAMMVIPLMFVSIGLLGAMRTSSWSGSTAGKSFESTTWSQSFALAEDEVVERNEGSAAVPVVERGFEVTDGPLLGRSYAAVFTAFIPRGIWPDKPRSAGSLYAQLFLGASKSGTTIPVNPEAEMYWNFGLPGVFLLSIIYGVILRWIYNFYWRRYPSPFALVFYLLMVTRFSFSTDRAVRLEQELVMVFICYALVTIFVPKHQSAPITNSLQLRRG